MMKDADIIIKAFEQYLHSDSLLSNYTGIRLARSIEDTVDHEYLLVLGYADIGGYIVPEDSICCLKASMVAKGKNYVAGIAELYVPEFSQRASSFILKRSDKTPQAHKIPKIHYEIRSPTISEEKVYLLPYEKSAIRILLQ